MPGQALYLAELLPDDKTAIVVVDSKAAAKAVCSRLGRAAVSCMSVTQWREADWSALAGRRVVVVASCSRLSRKRALDIADLLAGEHGCRAGVSLPEGDDEESVEHWIAEDGPDAVWRRIEALATPFPRRGVPESAAPAE